MNIVKLQSDKDYLINLDNVDLMEIKKGELEVWFNGDKTPCIYECNCDLNDINEQIINGDKSIRIV